MSSNLSPQSRILSLGTHFLLVVASRDEQSHTGKVCDQLEFWEVYRTWNHLRKVWRKKKERKRRK